MTDVDDADARYERERAFHDEEYESAARVKVWGFYSVLEACDAMYEARASERAGGGRVLEYGCGPGNDTAALAEQANALTSIDLSVEGLRQARDRTRRRGLPVSVSLMNAELLAFPAATFDAVCGRAILHHLDLERSFREVARALKPDGTAIFVEPLGQNPAINLFRHLTPRLRTPDEHPLVNTDFDLARRYFGHVVVHYFALLTILAAPFRNMRLFPRVLRLLTAADAALFRLVPILRRYAWYCVMELSEPRVG